MKHIDNSNYENDDKEYVSGFIEYLSGQKTVADSNNNINIAITNTIPIFKNNSTQKLTMIDVNSLYNIAGYIVRSIMKMCKTCNNCINSVKSNNPLQCSFTKFVNFKCYIKNALFFVNSKTFSIFILLEKMFRHYAKYFNIENIHWKSFLIAKFSQVRANHILNCHGLFTKIIKRFAVFRLRTMNKKDSNFNCKRYDGKSIAVHTFFK